ncbi:hypothetical protein A3K73_00545 [Candidatus Pacearchaeota archaeon RBG_13_36_9]|nr:MAG: hypothetical protein A3K73_00545 [Candidatus Pacearchaeota archaeon RBG_13_36_9]
MPTDPLETKNKILSILRFKGPSLPIHVASQIKISSIFAGAFLSELANEDAIKISNIKVGGSPLYYIKGQESMLDPFYKYLPEKEREAFLSLKQNKILEDKKQEPAIRVALRSLKDFAFPFKKDEEIFWRFHSTTEQEVREILEPKIKEKKEIPEPETKTKEQVQEIKEEAEEKPVKKEGIRKEKEPKEKEEKEEKKEEKIEVSKPKIIQPATKKDRQLDIGLKVAKSQKSKISDDIQKQEFLMKEKTEKLKIKKPEFQENFENPLIIKEEPKKKEKPKSLFVTDIIEKISRKYLIVEEKYYKPREYSCIVQINSELGPINFLAFATEKRKLSETDLKKMLSEAQKIPLPALVLHKGEISRKAADYSKSYFSVLKIERI